MGRFVSQKEAARREKAKAVLTQYHRQKSEDVVTQEEEEEEENVTSSDSNVTWKDGRRIIDLKYMLEQLKCQVCSEELDMKAITDERRIGLASQFNIPCTCTQCEKVNIINSSKTHVHGQRGPQVYDVNTKAAIGMIDSGMGVRQMNKFLAVMGIPGISEKSMKKREREIFKPVVTVAKQSCTEAIQEECNATRCETPLRGLAIKYDMCWQKRGSGRSYSSPSGVGTAIGQLTGKVLDFDICSSHCAMCRVAENRKEMPGEHNCPKNWNKSAKAMESVVGAKLMSNIEKESNTKVEILVMDHDSATISKVKEALGHDVEKWSDVNHATKSLCNALYQLQAKHKTMSTDVIKHFKRCFSYAIQQNKDNESGLKETLSTIVPHSFGDHDNCGEWCHAEEEGYSHKLLPQGKPLRGDAMKADIQTVFKTMSNNAHRLSPAGSTKDVESVNGMYSTKAPKRICYSSSESLRTRVSATVCKKNLGYNYVSTVTHEAELSPSKITEKFTDKLSEERKRKRKYSQKPEVKKRRINVHKASSSETEKKEKKEGTTYQSGVSLELVTEAKEIPGIINKPTLSNVDDFNGSVVIFDLETTSLKLDCDILQIAASNLVTNESFDCYVQSTKDVPPSTSAVTGLTNKGGVLFYRGSPVDTKSMESAFQSFVLWLNEQKPALLVGHNAKTFDSRRLILNISKFSCFGQFKESVVGFADTLPLFKDKFPTLDSYKQENLYRKFCSDEYDAHNAIEDVSSLKQIMKAVNVTLPDLLKISFNLISMVVVLNFHKTIKDEVVSFDTIISQKLLSHQMAVKIAQSGLHLSHLRFAYNRGGEQGLKDLLGQKRSDGSPRVTNTGAVVKKIARFFRENE